MRIQRLAPAAYFCVTVEGEEETETPVMLRMLADYLENGGLQLATCTFHADEEGCYITATVIDELSVAPH